MATGTGFFFRVADFERQGDSSGVVAAPAAMVEFGEVLAESTSFLVVNVGTSVVRSLLVANQVSIRVSMALVAKNLIMIVIAVGDVVVVVVVNDVVVVVDVIGFDDVVVAVVVNVDVVDVAVVVGLLL